MTKKIEWSHKLTTELVSVDRQHQKLINLFNDFLDAIANEMAHPDLCDLFSSLMDEVKSHFHYEEQIMKNIGFPDYNTHKRHHHSLLEDAVQVYQDLCQNDASDQVEASTLFLRALVLKHMVEQDLTIKDYLIKGTEG
ncbi:hemerythrin family protein [Terasakiella sp. SH-1]|uniref:bacteriohemerythrin n=1 Tax=Terasakiella sp. SH-1 TaxID=2560057 RepID=UPI00142FD00B|nr:hemerythrin family protein [Terasakiella sp. SH-1]